MRKTLSLLRMRLVLAFYWLACFAATHSRLPPGEPLFPHFDKLVHFCMYAGLGLLLGLRLAPRQLVWVIAVYAVLDETTQPWVGRTCDVADLAFDFVGAFVGGFMAQKILHRRGTQPA